MNQLVIKFCNNNNFFKNVFIRQISNGLNLWDSELTIETKHQIEKYWKEKIQNTNHDNLEFKDKFYVLSMFPYPSGSLHMGHVRVYTISDAVARFYRMQGKHVIHPIGWDSFGLPAENAAIERLIDPAEWTEKNIENMRKQLYELGCSFDMDREISTSHSSYYKWTQELFLKLYDNDLIYQKEDFVNWDPVDATVLADEQVDEQGRSWRSGAIVEKKLLKQWFIKTTALSKSLLEGLDDPILKEWKDIIKIQKNWIGKCTGTNIDFQISSNDSKYQKILTVFTEKPEFIENAKFIAISNNHCLNKFKEVNSNKIAFQKLNINAINPFTNEYLPIYVVDKESLPFSPFRDEYLGIPCTSDYDLEFCKKVDINYDEKILDYSSEEIQKKRAEILETAKEKKIGGYSVSSKIKDWLISRQRYWGTPIPIIHCDTCGCQPVPRSDLPVYLPKIKRTSLNEKITLNNAKEWLQVKCPNCRGTATRETDTMDTFVDSSWYFMRYIDSQNDKEMFSKEKAFQYLPVDLYIGGKEHAVLHLYYARFINHFLNNLGLVPTREPFKQLLVQGMVKGLAYRNKDGKYLKKEAVYEEENNFIEKSTKQAVTTIWEKMSKSKYNGVDPLNAFSEYSTDTIRLLMLADFAPTSDRKWSKETFPGILNWEKRLWSIVKNFIKLRNEMTEEELNTKEFDNKFVKDNDYMFDSRNYYINGITFNIIDAQQLSVAISKMQGLTNSIKKASKMCIIKSIEYERVLAALIIMLAPIAPHFASELWTGFCSAPQRLVNNNEIQWDKNVLEQKWPEVDMEYKLKLRVQLNGKDFMVLRIPRQELDGMSKDKVFQLIMNEKKLKKHLQNQEITDFEFRSRIGCGANISMKTKLLKKVNIEDTCKGEQMKQ